MPLELPRLDGSAPVTCGLRSEPRPPDGYRVHIHDGRVKVFTAGTAGPNASAKSRPMPHRSKPARPSSMVRGRTIRQWRERLLGAAERVEGQIYQDRACRL